MLLSHIYKPDGSTRQTYHNDESFASVEAAVKRWVESGSANKVEVFDTDGRLVHHYPKAMHH